MQIINIADDIKIINKNNIRQVMCNSLNYIIYLIANIGGFIHMFT